MKVVFLDIDGVLNVIPQGRDEFGPIFHKHFIDNLKIIIDETKSKIVITSTWGFDGWDIMEKMWETRGLPGEIIGITPHINICKRGKEIKAWLDIHSNIDNYVILDDDTDMLEYQMNNFVHCGENEDHEDCIDAGYGLTKECAEKAIKILNRDDKKMD